MASRMKKKRKKGFRLLTVFVLCILCVVGYNSLGLAAKQEKQEKKIDELNIKIEEEMQRTKDLEQKKAYTQTKKYVEDAARNYLGLVYPYEIIIKPED